MKPLCGGQYDNANFAFKFLNAYPDLVPIPGIEKASEIEEIAGIVNSGDTLQGAEKAEADAIAQKLGKQFCRRCGYCQPCPQGVPVKNAMIFDGMIKRLPPEMVAQAAARLVEKADDCIECGKCEERCPYDLPIIDTLQATAANARRIVAQWQTQR
jgi:hypothetical protein